MKFRKLLILLLILSMLNSMILPASMAEEGMLLAVDAAAVAFESAENPSVQAGGQMIEAYDEPTVESSVESSVETSIEPAAAPTGEATPEPGIAPTVEPPVEPTFEPGAEQTADPSVLPSVEPSFEPGIVPTAEPGAEQTVEPPAEPTLAPSAEPTVEPSAEPTLAPSEEPTVEPSAEPTLAPSAEPTVEPSSEPGVAPTAEPAVTPDPSVAQDVIPAVSELVLGLKEEIPLPAYSLLPETALDSVEYHVEGGGLSITKDGKLKAAKTGTHILTLTADSGASAEIPVTVLAAPRKIGIEPSRSSLCAGESLSCAVILPEGSAGAYSFSVSKPALLRDNGDGSFTALAKGSVRISVKSYNGKTASASLSIHPAPESITLPETALVLVPGEAYELKPVLNRGSKCELQFSASDASVVSVDESGRLIALGVGHAVLTASTCNGLSAACSVTVLPAAQSVRLSVDKDLLGVKEQGQLSVQLLPEGSGGSIRFSSSKPKVAKVDENGCITAMGTGSAVITAEAAGGASASLEISVKKAPDKLSISADRSRFGIGESFSCTAVLPKNSAGSVEFAASDSNVLVHNGGGSFTAVGMGSAVITAESYNGKSARLSVEVAAAPESISLNASERILGVGDSYRLVPLLSEGSASFVRYASSDPAVAAVDADGCILALNPGETIVTAESFNGLSAACRVEVHPAPEQILLHLDRDTIGVQESIPLHVSLLPEGSAASLSYSVSSASAAFVSEDGVITGLRDSRPTITVRTHNGLKAAIAVDVEKAPRSITLKTDADHLAVGELIRTEVSLPKYTAGATALTTDHPEILEIRPDGSVLAIAPGAAVLTASAYNGVSSSTVITVYPMPEAVLLPAEMRMGLGTDDRLPASLPAGTASALCYESLSPEIVSVDAAGMLHAAAAGSAVIRVTAVNSGAYAECLVSVLPLPEQILPESSSVTLLMGQSAAIACAFWPEESYSVLSYIPGDRRIVDVDANGLLTPLKAGTTSVTLRAANGVTASVQVVVPPAPKSITLSDSSLYLASGDVHMLDYSLNAGAQTIVSFASSSPEIARVDAVTGRIEALSTGTTCITARTLNGLHASCAVSVNIDEEREIEDGDELKVIFMDIDRNDGIIICCGGEYAFIDSGVYRYGHQAVEFMQSLGITELKYYIGTHAHQDHVGGAGVILEAFDVDMVIAPHSYVFSCIRRFCQTQAERDAVDATPTHIMTVGESIYIGGAKLSCIGPYDPYPHSYTSTSENNNSLVTQLSFGENSFLLTGDATRNELLEIEEKNPGSTKADVLKNPHHNGYQPIGVLEKVLPKIVVISTSNDARLKKKYRELLESLGCEIYITSSLYHSHVTITSDGTTLSVETASTPAPKS